MPPAVPMLLRAAGGVRAAAVVLLRWEPTATHRSSNGGGRDG